MITLTLTLQQAAALHALLTAANIEPELVDRPLLNKFHPLTDHILWPVLDDLRQQIQIAKLRDE